MSTLYDFYFVYNDGSYYYGTVADNGSYGYYSGETVSTSHTYGGYYYIYANAGATSQASGSVQTSSYYDTTSVQTYTPYYSGSTDGSSGLGSEYDWTYGASGYQYYGGGGTYEAKQH